MFDGALAQRSVREMVRVISSDDAAFDDYACNGIFEGPLQGSWRLVLEAADNRRWSAHVQIANLPANMVAVNDTVELVVEFSDGGGLFSPVSQFMSLAKDGERILLVFAGGRAMPQVLASQGIEVTNLGRICDAIGCGYEDLRARVKIGSSEAVFDPGETKQVQNVRLTIDENNQWDPGMGGCDNGGFLQGAGFAVPTSRSRSTVLANSR